MPVSDIILIIISGLGVIHGLFLSVFLWTYKKGRPLSNRLLSLLLVVLSFRIGKSVFLEFALTTDIKLIFVGLGTIMAIGPLYYFFTQSCAITNWQFKRSGLIHFIPSLLGVLFGLWLEEKYLESIPIWIFALLFLTYYLHLLTYLVISFSFTHKKKESLDPKVHKLIRLLFFGFIGIWVVYVLNLFDESIPYIIGPILYSLVAYVVSFIVIKNGYIDQIGQIKYKTTPASDSQLTSIYERVQQAVVDEKGYRGTELTLKALSEKLHISTQLLSMTINQKSQMNFNGYVNSFRINEATELLKDKKAAHLTIASIAFEVGFNSISSFNAAFKKQTGITPQDYRNQHIK